ncbi:MAG: response regulator transcription factor [Bdellovibrionales bacterium]|nr:response regulator transcription factor [Bdellovibrionales bacterium]
MTKLLLVEDEITLGDTIRLSLIKMGFECDWVKTLKEAREKLNHESYDLMILDRNLPDGEGTQLLKHPRRKRMMALILSSKSGVEERVEGLRRGADDYLPKPFSFKELEARIHALIRRRPGGPETHSGELWKLRDESMTIECETGEVALTPLEFKFMKYMLERKGAIVSKDRLLRDVWGFSFLPKTRTIDYLITQLRKRIELDPEHPKHLLTVRGAGVKFEP